MEKNDWKLTSNIVHTVYSISHKIANFINELKIFWIYVFQVKLLLKTQNNKILSISLSKFPNIIRFSQTVCLKEPPPQRCSCKQELFFFRLWIRENEKIVCEFVKTISFVIREKKKYRSRIREKKKYRSRIRKNWKICSWIREFQHTCWFWFVNWQNPVFRIVNRCHFSLVREFMIKFVN